MAGSCSDRLRRLRILLFAHHEGMLRSVSTRFALLGSSLLMTLGLVWAANHLGDAGWDLATIPMAQAAWSLGFCVIVLRFRPLGTISQDCSAAWINPSADQQSRSYHLSVAQPGVDGGSLLEQPALGRSVLGGVSGMALR